MLGKSALLLCVGSGVQFTLVLIPDFDIKQHSPPAIDFPECNTLN